MILTLNPELLSGRNQLLCKCDYCGKEFQRIKKQLMRGRIKNIKDACGDCTLTKTKETLKNKYNTECYFDSCHYKEQMNSKFGVESPSQSKYLMEKAEATRKLTLQINFGIENISQMPDHTEKSRQTSQEKYGKDHFSQTDECKLQVIQTSLEKYNKPYYSQTDEYKERQRNTLLEKYNATCYTISEEYKLACLEKHGVPYAFLKDNQSTTEIEIKQWLNNFGLLFKTDYSVLDGKQLDLYDPSLSLAVEYGALWWHNELSSAPRTKWYHYDKYKKCLEKGIQLITIFSDEWKFRNKQCKSILKSKIKVCKNIVYARNCKISKIDTKLNKSFCELHHLQGYNNLDLVAYGLFNKDELVATMSLGRHHRNLEKITLSRLCFKDDWLIPGGSSKLFKQCLSWSKDNNCKSIVTWSDNRWSQGNVYEKLGFALDAELPPDYSYIDLKTASKRLSKQSQKKSNTNCPLELSEKEWAQQRGLARIWDCGKRRWIYTP